MNATAPKSFEVDVLNRLAQTVEIVIDVPRPRPEAPALIHPRTIWVVVVGEHAYVRSWKGNAGRWYQEARTRSKAVVYLDGHPIPVRAVPVTDEATIAQVSDAYRRKYADDPYMTSMLREEVLPTTLRLEPQELILKRESVGDVWTARNRRWQGKMPCFFVTRAILGVFSFPGYP